MANRKVLIVYTGGTIGMVKKEDGSFGPFNFDELIEYVPELSRLPVDIEHQTFEEPIDSSNMNPEKWMNLAALLFEKRATYDGFVVLHGSDTMAYSASAVSFLLKDFNKPIIFTGSQLPIGIIRTDAKENLLTAIEIASSYEDDVPVVPETALYFEYHLYRGNRTIKMNAELFDAFQSPNYPMLAEAGVHLKFKSRYIAEMRDGEPQLFSKMSDKVGLLRIFPGMSPIWVKSLLNVEGIEGIVMETFGSGNAPTEKWFLDELQKTVDRGVLILNVTQCVSGSVDQGRYETSSSFNKMGIISAGDMTTAASITKMMFVLANVEGRENQIAALKRNLRGERSS